MNRILITGASSGVGRSLARYYFRKGFELILISRRTEFAKEDFGSDSRVTVHAVDLSRPEEATKKIDAIRDRHGYVPNIINNAGTLIKGSLEETSWADFEKAISINSRMPLYIMQAFLPLMKKEGFGRIINITSGAPLNCFPNVGVYSGTKGLLNAITVTIARETSAQNIRINLMSPGPVKSEMSPEAKLSPEICNPTIDYLLNPSPDLATGKFFWLGYEVPLFPDLEGVDWLNGIGNDKLKKVL